MPIKYSNKKFSAKNYLREIGVQDWIIDGDNDFKKFIDWFSNNITEDNVLNDAEVVRYGELVESSKFLNERQLEFALKEIEHERPRVWEYTNRDISDSDDKLKELAAMKERYDKLSQQLTPTEMQLIIQLDELAVAENRVAAEEEEIVRNCQEAVSKLQDAKATNQKHVNELVQCYMKPQKYPLFIHEMQLEQYFKKSDIFLKSAEVYMQHNFKVQSVDDATGNGKPSRDPTLDLVSELEEVTNRIYKSLYEQTDQNANIFAQKKLTEAFKNHIWVPVTEFELKEQVRQMAIKREQILEAKLETLTNKMEEQLILIAEQQGEMVIYKHNKLKMERANKRHEMLKDFADIVSDGVINAEIVWILMQLDIGRIKKRNYFHDLMQCYKDEALVSLKRIGTLNFLRQSAYHQADIVSLLEQIEHILSNQTNTIALDTSSVNDLYSSKIIQDINRMKLNVNNGLLSMLDINGYTAASKFFSDLNDVENIINRFIFDGPVNCPQFWNVEFANVKSNMKMNLKRSTEKLVLTKHEFEEYQMKAHNDKFWRYKQHLWIYFLSEPKKVMKIIQMIATEAQEQAKLKPQIKSIAGISRKR